MTRLWAYAWKSSDGIRREDLIEASTREEAFRLLREKGIRPIKVTQCLRPIDRAISFLRRFGIIAAVAIAVFFVARITNEAPLATPTSTTFPIVPQNAVSRAADRIAIALPRRQVNLDVIDLNSAFKYDAERFLACFASPGVLDNSVIGKPLPPDTIAALESPLVIYGNDPQELVDLKRIVAGLKEDVARFLSSGKSLSEVAEWLTLRQQMEDEFRRQLIGGRERDRFSKDAINSKLRAMGLREL